MNGKHRGALLAASLLAGSSLVGASLPAPAFAAENPCNYTYDSASGFEYAGHYRDNLHVPASHVDTSSGEEAQCLLTALSQAPDKRVPGPGPIDGLWDQESIDSMKAAQTWANQLWGTGLDVDGWPGPGSWQALRKLTGTKTQMAGSPANPAPSQDGWKNCPSNTVCFWVDGGFAPANAMGELRGGFSATNLGKFPNSLCTSGNWNDCLSSFYNNTSSDVYFYENDPVPSNGNGVSGGVLKVAPGVKCAVLPNWDVSGTPDGMSPNDKITSIATYIHYSGEPGLITTC
jgi:hypothetical protein